MTRAAWRSFAICWTSCCRTSAAAWSISAATRRSIWARGAAALCQARGVGRVYLDFLLAVAGEAQARGRTPQYWGDIIIGHPELIPELPRDGIALEWGYEAGHPFDEHGARFAAVGVPFYVCPGTSSWNSIAGRTTNALGNLRNVAENGLRHSAIGYLITDWGDNGHWQPLPISYLGFAAGAAYAWAWEANRGLEIALALSRHAFRDPGGAMGRVASDLGDVYRTTGIEPPNSSALFWALQEPPGAWDAPLPPRAAIERTLAALDAALAPLDSAAMERPDAALVRREFQQAAQLLRLACRRVLLRLEPDEAARRAFARDLTAAIEEQRSLWLVRNRPGGLPDSLARFEPALRAV
jgi:hypothetical protein